MARPRKPLKFANVLQPLSIADLKVLKSDVAAEIKMKDRESRRLRIEKETRRVRDSIKIGSTITFTGSGADKKSLKAEVIGIFIDKVQVMVGGRKRTVAFTRVTNVA